MSRHYRGSLYRAINPVYARDPLSGAGAAKYGGRFNAMGTPALYTSLTPETAMREANQAGRFQPITLVAYDADIANIFDCSDQAALARFSMDAMLIADPGWRDKMKADGIAPTQSLANRLREAGFNGLLVRSFAPQATAIDLNLVLWRWSAQGRDRLTPVDDEDRLLRR